MDIGTSSDSPSFIFVFALRAGAWDELRCVYGPITAILMGLALVESVIRIEIARMMMNCILGVSGWWLAVTKKEENVLGGPGKKMNTRCPVCYGL